MSVDRSIQARNDEARARLRAQVASLSDADLARPVSHGWTVAATLVHLAFWDLRAVQLMDHFGREGAGPLPAEVDVLNDTLRVLADLVPPRAAVRLALEAAEAVDRRIEALPDATIAALAAAGNPFSLTREPHRTEHLAEIERVLPRPPA